MKLLGPTPSGSTDAVPKSYADSQLIPFGGASTMWQFPSHAMGGGGATAVTSGNLEFIPFDVGPVATTYSNIGVGVSVAQVGGTSTTTLAIYPDDGTWGRPATVTSLFSGTITLTSTGNRTATLSNLVLQPGRYWLAWLYVATVAPSTVATVYMHNNTLQLAGVSGTVIGANPNRGWFKASQTVMPTTDIRSTLSSVSSTAAPVIALQVA